MSEANAEQAERCAEIAYVAFNEGKLDAALRMVEKSLRLYPTPVANALKARIESRSAAASERDVPSPSPSSSPPASSPSVSESASAGERRPSTTSGLRARASAAAGRNGVGAAAAPTHTAPQRSYTVEQVEIVTQVKRAKDYYEVLTVEKSADGDVLKKAYRKLAVKLHPDKNAAPGAEEAFKRVAAAFAILSDADKRASYDRYGETDTSTGGGEAAETRSRHYARYEQEVSPEDLFNMFFGIPSSGGVPFGATVYTSDGRTYRQAGRQQRRTAASPGMLCMLVVGLCERLRGGPWMEAPLGRLC